MIEGNFLKVLTGSLGEENSAADDFVPIEFDNIKKKYFFNFQKRKFILNEKDNTFYGPSNVLTSNRDEKGSTIGHFKHAPGLSKDHDDVDDMKFIYGENKFDIPIPTFLELFKQHAVAPFFIFQVFCICLWFLDELWYYSLFSLFMLFTFESTVVWQRQTALREFRSMSIVPYELFAFRNKKWEKIMSDQLLPNDVISVTRSGETSGLPCDLLLLNGNVIVNEAMLSGESTPLLKESIALRPDSDKLDVEGQDKNSLLFGGTKVLQVTAPNAGSSKIPAPPDGGALALVTKTGFETTQGNLVRLMIFSSEHVGAGNKEAYYFIGFLLIFAVAASRYVWTEGLKMDRKRSKLILDCVLIVTSVVPPELPMELTMAVNTSLAALSKYYIFCTEPFRIPLAGKIDVCCFDKTGTLTGEDLVLEGIANNESLEKGLINPMAIEKETEWVMASAHALVLLEDGEVVGDPMEQNTLKSIKWKVGKNDEISKTNTEKEEKVKILRRFQFSSSLKRSSSVVKVPSSRIMVAAKGAPETIKHRLTSVPENYDATFKHYTRSGSRVLALAYKFLDASTTNNQHFVTKLEREYVETDLIFAGFLVFHCPLKDDAINTVKMLNESSHRVVMITGDNPLTAVHVSKVVKIVERTTLILDIPEGSNKLVWSDPDEVISEISVDVNEPLGVSELYGKYDLCLTGHAISELENHPEFSDLIQKTWIFARVSPSQKELILQTLKSLGYITLMCGDGTNDVGALKQAHVGVALLNGTEKSMAKLQEDRRRDATKKVYDKQSDLMKRWSGQVPPVPELIADLYPPGPLNPHYVKAVEKRGGKVDIEAMNKLIAENQSQPQNTEAQVQAASMADKLTALMNEEDEDEAPKLKLGDASVAAPFTSKLGNVSTITHIIRQGRCTLIATIQMYKILALNCLISAYSLSVLYLSGIKMGDTQATISGILLSVCFLSISRSKPIEKLVAQRPVSDIFGNGYVMPTILGQFAIHIAVLVYISKEVYILDPLPEKIDLESKFAPSLLNTAIYLIQLWQHLSTFVVNYEGRPFRQSLTENRLMYYGILGVAGVALSGASGMFLPDEIWKLMGLVDMDDTFRFKLVVSMLLDLSLSWSWDKLVRLLGSSNTSYRIGELGH